MVYKSVVLLLTNACSSGCSFCYRRKLIKNLGNGDMSLDMALRILRFSIDKDIIDDESQIVFWGGEPLDKPDIIHGVVSEYPQLSYSITTNRGFNTVLQNIPRLGLVWSMGDYKEKYGSVSNKIDRNKDMVEFIKRYHHGISFLSDEYKKLYDNYCQLRDITDQVIIELPMKYKIMSEEEINLFSDQLCKIMLRFDGSVLLSGRDAESYIGRIESGKSFQYCGCGLDRIMFDGNGSAWRCDGSYINQVDNIGSIDSGIDWDAVDKYRALLDHPESLYENCTDCEVYGYCVRTKCLGDNLEVTGDIYKTDRAFCAGCIAFYRGVKKYLLEIKNAEKSRPLGIVS